MKPIGVQTDKTIRRIIRCSQLNEIRERVVQLDELTLEVASVATAHYAQTGVWMHASRELMKHPIISELPIFKAVHRNVPQHSFRNALSHGVKLAKNPEAEISNRIEDYFLKRNQKRLSVQLISDTWHISNMRFKTEVVGDIPSSANLMKYHIELDSDEFDLADDEAVMVITLRDSTAKPDPVPPQPVPPVPPDPEPPVPPEPPQLVPPPPPEPPLIIRLWWRLVTWIFT